MTPNPIAMLAAAVIASIVVVVAIEGLVWTYLRVRGGKGKEDERTR